VDEREVGHAVGQDVARREHDVESSQTMPPHHVTAVVASTSTFARLTPRPVASRNTCRAPRHERGVHDARDPDHPGREARREVVRPEPDERPREVRVPPEQRVERGRVHRRVVERAVEPRRLAGAAGRPRHEPPRLAHEVEGRDVGERAPEHVGALRVQQHPGREARERRQQQEPATPRADHGVEVGTERGPPHVRHVAPDHQQQEPPRRQVGVQRAGAPRDEPPRPTRRPARTTRGPRGPKTQPSRQHRSTTSPPAPAREHLLGRADAGRLRLFEQREAAEVGGGHVHAPAEARGGLADAAQRNRATPDHPVEPSA
jgi:hypothetical protein